MAMFTIRDNTQPALPSLARTRLQSSITGGAGGAAGLESGLADGSSPGKCVFDSSCQLGGSFGAAGMGGGGIFAEAARSFDLRRVVLGRGGGCGTTGAA